MGEEIEIRDVNGNLVRVPMYPALATIGATLRRGEAIRVPLGNGFDVEARLYRHGVLPTIEENDVDDSSNPSRGDEP